MPVAILGDRNCGKTVFLSLLYDTQIEYTNETKQNFRYYANPEFTRTMGKIVDGLMMGQWPDATLKGMLMKYWFLFGYRKKILPTKYDTIKFTVYDIAGEDVNIIDELISPYRNAGGTFEGISYEDLPEGLKTLLDCNVLVFILDASRINEDPRSEAFESMLKYDTFMATLISLVAEYKSKVIQATGQKLLLYPVFVFTKFDMVDPKILSALKLESRPPSPTSRKNIEKRKEYAEKLMKHFYRKTLALKRGSILQLKNVCFDRSGYFFSYMATELNEDGEPVPKIIPREAGGGVSYRLDYSINEYKAFIEYFRDIAKSMPDEVRDEQEFTTEK